jgi:hypothetical protein
MIPSYRQAHAGSRVGTPVGRASALVCSAQVVDRRCGWLQMFNAPAHKRDVCARFGQCACYTAGDASTTTSHEGDPILKYSVSENFHLERSPLGGPICPPNWILWGAHAGPRYIYYPPGM